MEETPMPATQRATSLDPDVYDAVFTTLLEYHPNDILSTRDALLGVRHLLAGQPDLRRGTRGAHRQGGNWYDHDGQLRPSRSCLRQAPIRPRLSPAIADRDAGVANRHRRPQTHDPAGGNPDKSTKKRACARFPCFLRHVRRRYIRGRRTIDQVKCRRLSGEPHVASRRTIHTGQATACRYIGMICVGNKTVLAGDPRAA